MARQHQMSQRDGYPTRVRLEGISHRLDVVWRVGKALGASVIAVANVADQQVYHADQQLKRLGRDVKRRLPCQRQPCRQLPQQIEDRRQLRLWRAAQELEGPRALFAALLDHGPERGRIEWDTVVGILDHRHLAAVDATHRAAGKEHTVRWDDLVYLAEVNMLLADVPGPADTTVPALTGRPIHPAAARAQAAGVCEPGGERLLDRQEVIGDGQQAARLLTRHQSGMSPPKLSKFLGSQRSHAVRSRGPLSSPLRRLLIRSISSPKSTRAMIS